VVEVPDRFEEFLPEPRAITITCPITGREAYTFDIETLYVLIRLLPFPPEYWFVSDEVRERFMGRSRPEIELRNALRQGLIPPVYASWVKKCIDEMRRYRGRK